MKVRHKYQKGTCWRFSPKVVKSIDVIVIIDVFACQASLYKQHRNLNFSLLFF